MLCVLLMSPPVTWHQTSWTSAYNSCFIYRPLAHW